MADKLISFFELVKEFNTHCGGDCEFCDHHLRVHGKSKTRCLILNSLRAADAVHVVHGYSLYGDEYAGHHDVDCSVCGESAREYFDYCPNCGAKMDGGSEQ